MELASPETSPGVNMLLVSTPSVKTTIARRAEGRCSNCRAVVAIASYRDVVPNGSALLKVASIAEGCGVKACSSCSDSSNVNIATSSRPS